MRDIAKILAELRDEANIDFIDLPQIASAARYDLSFESEKDIRQCSLEIAKGLMELGVFPGDYDYADQLNFWPGTINDHVMRIEAEWIAMGRTPTLADPICWFGLRSSEDA